MAHETKSRSIVINEPIRDQSKRRDCTGSEGSRPILQPSLYLNTCVNLRVTSHLWCELAHSSPGVLEIDWTSGTWPNHTTYCFSTTLRQEQVCFGSLFVLRVSLVFHSSLLIWGLRALAFSCALTLARCGEAERMCKSDIKHARFPSWGRAMTAEEFVSLLTVSQLLQKRAALQLHNGPRWDRCKIQDILRWKALVTWQKACVVGGGGRGQRRRFLGRPSHDTIFKLTLTSPMIFNFQCSKRNPVNSMEFKGCYYMYFIYVYCILCFLFKVALFFIFQSHRWHFEFKWR